MIIHLCDHCKKELSIGEYQFLYIRTYRPMTESKVELCNKCYNEVIAYLPIVTSKVVEKIKQNDSRKKNPELSD